jgi:hypothetical protein
VREPWIGLVEAAVREPRPRDLDADIAGAFLNFVCVVSDADEYQREAEAHLADAGWAFVTAEEVHPVWFRLQHWKPERSVQKIIRKVSKDGVARSQETWDVFPYEERE